MANDRRKAVEQRLSGGVSTGIVGPLPASGLPHGLPGRWWLPGGVQRNTPLRPALVERDLAAFDQIQNELRTQYLVSYTPTNKAADGKYRKLDITCGSNRTVQARKGYYAIAAADN